MIGTLYNLTITLRLLSTNVERLAMCMNSIMIYDYKTNVIMSNI